MDFPKECKLHRAAESLAAHRGHGAKSYVGLDKEGRYPVLVATNGRILAVVAAEHAEEDKAGPLPAAAVQAACNAKGSLPGRILHNGDVQVPLASSDGLTFPAVENGGHLPDNWRQIGRETEFQVTLDVRYLAKLASALGADAVTLNLDPRNPGASIRVGAWTQDPLGRWERRNDRYGAIMPILDRT